MQKCGGCILHILYVTWIEKFLNTLVFKQTILNINLSSLQFYNGCLKTCYKELFFIVSHTLKWYDSLITSINSHICMSID